MKGGVILEEKLLIKRIKDGDVDAFEDIIALYEKKVFGIIYQITKNQNEIEDLAQEVFIKIYRNIDKFQGNSSLYTWIYKITVNLCLDELRKKKEVIYLDEKINVNDGEIELQLPSKEKNQEQQYEEKELKEKMQIAIDRLPDKQKMMIVLRDIKGFTYEEISEITGIKLGTVKSQINRARLKLKELLEKDGTLIEYIESN